MWDCIEMYKNDSSYCDVLQELFGAMSYLTISHKKNKNFNQNFE